MILAAHDCIRNHMDAELNGYIDLYGHYKRGILPWSGGLLDQPAPFLVAMELIEAAIQEHDDG